MTAGTLELLLAVTLALAVAGVAVYARGADQARLAARRAGPHSGGRGMPRWRRLLDRTVVRTRRGRTLEGRLRAGGLDLRAGDAVGGAVLLAVAIWAALSRIIATEVAALIAVGLLVALNRYVDHRIRRRQEQFAQQLPDLARTLSNAAGAGMAIPNALELAARELDEPAGGVIAELVQQLRVGQSLAGALESLREKMPSREVAVLVSTLVIQQRAGGDVITALRDMSETLEQRRDLRREVRTVLSGVVFTAWAVAGLGLVSILLLNVVAPGTLREMTETWPGRISLATGLAFFTAGFLAVRKLARVDL